MDKNPHQSHSSLILVSPQRQFMKKHNFYSRMLNSRRTLSALLYMHCSLPVPSTGFSVSIYINHGCPDTIPLHRLVGMSGPASTALKGKAIPHNTSRKKDFYVLLWLENCTFGCKMFSAHLLFLLWGLWQELLSIRWISIYFHIPLILQRLRVRGFWVLWENRANHKCFSWGNTRSGSDC